MEGLYYTAAKKVVKISPTELPTEKIQHGHPRLIRATISPVPEQILHKGDKLAHPSIHTLVESVINDRDEWVEEAEDDQLDENDILQQIKMFGILDYNPKESFSANNSTDDSGNANVDVRAQSTGTSDQFDTKQMDDVMKYIPRRPRGRPAKRATAQRESLCSSSICIHMMVGIRSKCQESGPYEGDTIAPEGST